MKKIIIILLIIILFIGGYYSVQKYQYVSSLSCGNVNLVEDMNRGASPIQKLVNLFFIIGYDKTSWTTLCKSMQTHSQQIKTTSDKSKEVPLQEINNLGYTFYLGQQEFLIMYQPLLQIFFQRVDSTALTVTVAVPRQLSISINQSSQATLQGRLRMN